MQFVSVSFSANFNRYTTKPTKWHVLPAKTDQPDTRHSDQSLRCRQGGSLAPQLFFKRRVKTD